MANEQQERVTEEIQINPTTVVPYPATELKDLKKILSYDGVAKTIYDNTGITAPTLRSITRDKKGQYAKVTALRDFVKQYNKQVA